MGMPDVMPRSEMDKYWNYAWAMLIVREYYHALKTAKEASV